MLLWGSLLGGSGLQLKARLLLRIYMRRGARYVVYRSSLPVCTVSPLVASLSFFGFILLLSKKARFHRFTPSCFTIFFLGLILFLLEKEEIALSRNGGKHGV